MEIICPLCRHTLTRSAQRWHCENRHSFDIAKQGYSNLLPVQHKKSKQPGDDAAMVAARSTFLNKGYYQPLASAIGQQLLTHFESITAAQPHAPINILDAGCGEGYYSSALLHNMADKHIDTTIIGCDISKFAVKAAAIRDKQIQWFVANSNALPVADHSSDILLSLFAPLQAAEFNRALAPGGQLIVASTGRDHLLELRRLLYDQVNDKVLDPSRALAGYFTATDTTTIRFSIELTDNASLQQLFAMTPHYWRVSPERKKRLDNINQITLSVDIQLHSFRPVPQATQSNTMVTSTDQPTAPC